jgi:sec-independent protein translocase protein TatC
MDETRLPLTDHLAELRTRIIRVLLAWVVGSIAAWSYSDEIFALLLAPAIRALGEGQSLQAIAPSEIFFSYVKCALLAGFVFALPVIFWQIWAFVAPGLYANEKKAIGPFVIVSTLLFAGGAVFGYTQILPAMFAFFTSYDSELVQSAWSMHEVFKLTTRMFLAFGVAFELPVFVFFLAIAGIVEPRDLLRGTRYAVLVIFVVAAVLTPSPDWVSQVMLGVPMVVLYLIGVGVAFAFGPRRERAAATTLPAAASPPAASRDPGVRG